MLVYGETKKSIYIISKFDDLNMIWSLCFDHWTNIRFGVA